MGKTLPAPTFFPCQLLYSSPPSLRVSLFQFATCPHPRLQRHSTVRLPLHASCLSNFRRWALDFSSSGLSILMWSCLELIHNCPSVATATCQPRSHPITHAMSSAWSTWQTLSCHPDLVMASQVPPGGPWSFPGHTAQFLRPSVLQ